MDDNRQSVESAQRSRALIGVTLFIVLPAAAFGVWRWQRWRPPAAVASGEPWAPRSPADPAWAEPPSAVAAPITPVAPVAPMADRGRSVFYGAAAPHPPAPAVVPPPAGSHRIFSWAAPGSRYDVDVYAVDGVTTVENARAHRQGLEAAGFHVKVHEMGPERATMVATRGGTRATVVVIGDQKGDSTTSVITAGTGAEPGAVGARGGGWEGRTP